MNDIALLTARLEADPNNPIVASMLVDELVGERGMTYSEAFRHTANVMVSAESAAKLRRATALMCDTSHHRWLLRREIRRAAGLGARTPSTILVISGDSAPVTRSLQPGDFFRCIPLPVVTVGAGWVLTAHETRALVSRARRIRQWPDGSGK
jgi:hypothetical protein